MTRLLPRPQSYGASTEGETQEEALTHIHSILLIILEQIKPKGATIPAKVKFPQWYADLGRNLIHRLPFQYPAKAEAGL